MLNLVYKNSLFIGTLLLAGLLVGCSSSDSHNPSTTPAATSDIVDTAIADGNFTQLVAALQAAGLVDALKGPGPFTVFAPTDTAFGAIPANALNALLTDPNKAPLQDILKYHVFDGEVLASTAITLAGQSVPMLNGDLLAIDTAGADLVLNTAGTSATVVQEDILTTNGVIHVIDVVLDPADGKSTIVDKLDNLGNFTTLLTAVGAVPGLAGTLSGPGPFTLFAPTDTAFGKIPAATITALLADIPTLQNILTYHAIGSEIFAVDAIAASGSTVTTLNTSDVAVDLVGSDLYLNFGGSSPAIVTVTDYISTNGVIHVIDTVLDPNDAP
jgi:transforming growth factor-beta-induced protein